MNMIGSLLKSSKSDEIAADFVAFVADKESVQVLKSFVLDEAVPHTHIAEGGINEAIAQLAKLERSPQILMIDLQGSDMPLSDLARLASVCEPSTQVIALGERNDVGLYRSLPGIGIRDYLVKPLTVGLLKRTIDLRAGLQRGRYSINLFANNISDERAYLSTFLMSSVRRVTVNTPRTIGLMLSAQL